MSTHANKSPRYLILKVLATEGPQTIQELIKHLPSLTAEQVRGNAQAAKPPGYIKSQKDDVTGLPVYAITPAGKGWLKAQGDKTSKAEVPPAESVPAAPHFNLVPVAYQIEPHPHDDTPDTLAPVIADMHAIGEIAKTYMQEGELIIKGVRTMDQLIAVQGQLLEVLREQLEATEASLRQAQAGPYVVATNWIKVKDRPEALERAVEMAGASSAGVAIIGLPMQIAKVHVSVEDYAKCADTALCSN